MKFKHLNVPESWERYFSKYPQGMTILEALFEWVSQVDDMVDNQNKLNDNVEQFRNEIDAFVERFDDRLQAEVTQTLSDWQNSGFLDVVISEALQWQLTDYIATNEADKLSFTAQLAETKQDILDRGYNVKNFGAIGDGNSHPLIEKYSSLDEAQAVYPFATSLSQEIDWCAFTKMFKLANTTKKKCYIPDGDYYLYEPLEPIGTISYNSTEFGNFIVEGESMNNTTLLFYLTSNDQVGFSTTANSSGWDISNFRVKNIIAGKKGTGLYLNQIYKSNVRNIQAIYFNIGIRTSTYVCDITNLNGTNCICGIYIGAGTSTNFNSLWGASNKKEDSVEAYAGCGFYIRALVYSKLNSCAADSNDTAYKVHTTNDYTGAGAILEFDNCGCEVNEQAYIIDSPSARIIINNPSMHDISSGKLLHVENANDVVISGFNDRSYAGFTVGANVGIGVVKLNNTSINTGGNPSFFPVLPIVNNSEYGSSDFVYKGVRVGSATLLNGNLMSVGNKLEFEVYANNNGSSFFGKIDVLPSYNGTGSPLDRGGTIYFGGSNSGGYLTLNSSKTNNDIQVSFTRVKREDGAGSGCRIVVSPFVDVVNETSNSAVFKCELYTTPVGVNNIAKNHNIKLTGTYTGRENIRLKGVDY